MIVHLAIIRRNLKPLTCKNIDQLQKQQVLSELDILVVRKKQRATFAEFQHASNHFGHFLVELFLSSNLVDCAYTIFKRKLSRHFTLTRGSTMHLLTKNNKKIIYFFAQTHIFGGIGRYCHFLAYFAFQKSQSNSSKDCIILMVSQIFKKFEARGPDMETAAELRLARIHVLIE